MNLFYSDWLKDKETSSPFAILALYQPASKIPLEVWHASPSTSNGNEQAHRSINRDGTKLTMLAGIHRGMQYDVCTIQGLRMLEAHSIHSRDQQATHFRQAACAIVRSGKFSTTFSLFFGLSHILSQKPRWHSEKSG